MQADCISGEPSRLRSAIDRLVTEAAREVQERRRAGRQPFFRPISISRRGRFLFAGFARDISSDGIGLLHSVPLPQGKVTLTISGDDTVDDISLPSEILWCQPCGKGWYLSGAKFCDDTIAASEQIGGADQTRRSAG